MSPSTTSGNGKSRQRRSSFFSKILKKSSRTDSANTSMTSSLSSVDWQSNSSATPTSAQRKNEFGRLNSDKTLSKVLSTDSLDSEDKVFDQRSDGEVDLDEIISDDAGVISSDDAVTTSSIIDDHNDTDSNNGIFSIPSESMKFPKYIKASRKNNKSPRVLENLFLAQELSFVSGNTSSASSISDLEDGAASPDLAHMNDSKVPMNPHEILVMEFSRDGKYLAVAGRDSRIKIWQVISSPLSRLNYKAYENKKDDDSEKRSRSKVFSSAPVFLPEPVRVFEGHSKSVLCLDWSKNNFLLSGSMDKTVKLWNIERSDCLATFQHHDFVTALRFHPNDDRFFVSGALDNNLRLWSILESSVAYTNDLGDNALITALEFTPSGNHCLVGGFNGSIFALETLGLHLVTRIELRKKSKISSSQAYGNKITGIQVYENPTCKDLPGTALSKWNALITTNDSCIRLIDLSLRKLVTRFRGNSNRSSSIVASLSEDHRYIISGSEDHWCYVWDNNNSIINHKLRLAMKEMLLMGHNQLTEKHKRIAKVLHDNKLWNKLPAQGFLEDENGKRYIANDNNSYASFHAHHSRVNVAIFAPEKSKQLLRFSDDVIFDLMKRASTHSSHDHHNEQDQSRTSDHIIVTSDITGLIRVFRQDSAFFIRKSLVMKQKRCRRTSYRDLTDEFDTNSYIERMMKIRSKSPAQEGQSYFRSKLHNKLRGRTNSLSTVGGSRDLKQVPSTTSVPHTFNAILTTPTEDDFTSKSMKMSNSSKNNSKI